MPYYPPASTGGATTPPVELQGTDPAEAVLTLRADDTQTEHIFRVYNLDGDLVLDVDNNGILDTILFNVQSPPDTGSGNESSFSHISPGEWVINSGTAPASPMSVNKWDAGSSSYVNRFRVGYANGVLNIFPTDGPDVAVVIGSPASPTGNAIEVWDNAFNNLLFAVPQTGGVIFPSADPHVVGAWWDNSGTLTRSAG